MSRRRLLRYRMALSVTATVAALALSGADARSQVHRLIVPFPPGGGADILARLLTEQVRRTEGLSFVIENRVGAGSVIGTEAVAHAAPDGNTLLINTPNLLIASHVRKLSYDPLTSFDPVCKLVNSPAVLAVNAASDYHSLADLVNAARAHPGDLTVASVGPATTLHLAVEKLKRATGSTVTYVPFPGSGPAANAVLGQHVSAMFSEYPAVSAQLDAHALRPLATASPVRPEPLPDVPTVAESGYPGFDVDIWWGVFAPASTPAATLSRFADVFSRAIAAPEIRGKLTAAGFYPASQCGGDFAAYLRRLNDEYGQLIRAANLRGE